jgi:hypothetical protein
MKIAICLIGQPRTWEKCYHTWMKLIDTIKLNYKVDDVDIFFHMWDYNSAPNGLSLHEGYNYKDIVGDAPISYEEKSRLITALNPKKYLFENEIANKNKIKEVRKLNVAHLNHHGEAKLEWAAGQFYSIMHACHLKKMYEYEHNIRYDICIRMRTDLYFDDQQIKHFVGNNLVLPETNTFYSCHTSKDESQFPFHRIGDIFWFADSATFNRICDFYRWLPILGRKSFNGNHITTEHALYFYSKMLNMEISHIDFDPKIFRGKEYLDRKIKAGMDNGELGGHELI